jgi:hypothetical protein
MQGFNYLFAMRVYKGRLAGGSLTLIMLFFAAASASPSYSQGLALRDGQYVGRSDGNENVLAVVRSGRIISAVFEPRVSGCDDSRSDWNCSQVNKEIKAIDSCSFIWTVPWEPGFSYKAKLSNRSC